MERTKTSIKLLMVLGFTLLGISMFGTTKVQAYGDTYGIVKSGTVTSNSLDSLTETINVNTKETEFEAVSDKVFKQVVAELKKQNIIVEAVNYSELMEQKAENYTLVSVITPMFEGFIDIHKVNINIRTEKRVNESVSSQNITNKNCSVNFINSSSYNETDKNYVENAIKNLPNNYIGFKDVKPTELASSKIKGYEVQGTKYMEENSVYSDITLENTINDTKIKSIETGSYGGSGMLTMPRSVSYLIFKNDVAYANLTIKGTYGTQITVPNNIEDTDTAYIKYATPKINEILKKTDKNTTLEKLEKVSGYYYKYTLKNSSIENTGIIVIKKAEGISVGNDIYVDNLDENVNIKSVKKANTSMENQIKNKGYNNILGSYELTLEGTTELKEPISLTFDVGTQYNNKVVYILHQKKDNNYENFEQKVVNGKVSITVSELSPFVIALKEESSNNKPSDETTTPTTPTEPTKPDTTTSEHKLDETPKTGIENNLVSTISSILSMVSFVGIALIKKF